MLRKIIISILALIASVGIVKAYTVVSGDSMSKIAQNANLSLSELIEMNPQVENPDLIHIGDEIYTGGTGESLLGGTKPFAGSTYNLAGAGISSSDTSMTLTSLTIKQTGQKIADGDLSDTFYLTLEPGNNTKQEIAACTTVTQNANGSATLSGCSRGMSPIFPYTASSTLAFTHGGGSQVIFSDPPQLWVEFTGKSNDEQITGTWGFSKVPTTTDECSEAYEFCTKTYIDNSVNQGAATSTTVVSGISELATQIEMASSTTWTAVDPHVIQSQYASSTPSAGDHGLYVVVSENDGYINQGWLDLTEAFTFSSSTITSLYVGSATTTSKLVVGSSQPTTDAELFVTGDSYVSGNATTTGSMNVGELCFDGGQCETSPSSKLVYVNYIPKTVVNDINETTLYSFTLPGGTLGTTGVLHIKVLISDFDYEGESSGGSGVAFNLKYDDTTVASMDNSNFSDGAIDNLFGDFEGFITASSSAVLQRGFGSVKLANLVSTSDPASNHVLWFNGLGGTAGAENSATDLTVYVTVNWGAADAQSEITVKGIIAEVIR